MSNHVKHGSVDAVYNNIDYMNAVASQASQGVNIVGQQHMPGLQRHQHMPLNVGAQNIPRTRQVSLDMGAVSPRTQSFAYPQAGYPMAIPEEYTFQQTPIQPLRMPSNVRRHSIGHPNQEHVRPPRRSVAFARQPEFIYDSEESSDEDVFPLPEHFRPRHASVPVPRYIPPPGAIGSNPVPMVVNTPIVMTGNPMAGMQGNPMGLRQGSMSMPPNHVQVNPQQVQVPMDIHTRPYSYLTSYRPGTRYPTMVNDLEILANVLNPKNNNLKQFVDVLARRSPYELDALRYEFSVMTGGQDLQLTFNSLVTKEDESIKSVISGLTLGPIAFDVWLLDGVLLPTLSMTDD
jgi:hypothetical protein